MRSLTVQEKKAILEMAWKVANEKIRNQLLQDLDLALVEEANPGGSVLRFYIEGYQRPPYRGQDTFRGLDGFPVAGSLKDKDGTEVEVNLYLDQNDRVLELELIRISTKYEVDPDWSTFKVI
jgi:hypothetical protein